MAIRSKLIEQICDRIFKRIKAEFKTLKTLEVKVTKLLPPMNGDVASTSVVTLTPDLLAPVQGQAGANRMSFDVTYAGTEGGRFTRSNAPYELLSVPQ